MRPAQQAGHTDEGARRVAAVKIGTIDRVELIIERQIGAVHGDRNEIVHVQSGRFDGVLDGVEDSEFIDVFVYPGVQHAFARVDGVHYDARAATIANGRTTELLSEMLDSE